MRLQDSKAERLGQRINERREWIGGRIQSNAWSKYRLHGAWHCSHWHDDGDD